MKTPITDAEELRQIADYNLYREPGDPSFPADFEFARKLESKLADVTKDLAAAKAQIAQLKIAGSNLHGDLCEARHKLRCARIHTFVGERSLEVWAELTR